MSDLDLFKGGAAFGIGIGTLLTDGVGAAQVVWFLDSQSVIIGLLYFLIHSNTASWQHSHSSRDISLSSVAKLSELNIFWSCCLSDIGD